MESIAELCARIAQETRVKRIQDDLASRKADPGTGKVDLRKNRSYRATANQRNFNRGRA